MEEAVYRNPRTQTHSLRVNLFRPLRLKKFLSFSISDDGVSTWIRSLESAPVAFPHTWVSPDVTKTLGLPVSAYLLVRSSAIT
jgi:hypothetical protein